MTSSSPTTSQPERTARPVEHAAGLVCWREAGPDGRRGERSLEVLLVHRPRYDDWSFPKGKVEPGETLPECALRETTEETGVRALLGQALPTVRYTLPDGRPKEVAYWSARLLADGRPGTAEVDRTVWLDLPAARDRLDRDSDRALLDALGDLSTRRRLPTRPLLVVRHATARPRQAWTHADADRPLVAAGRRQALSLAALLQCWSPQYLLSSPWLRCVETLAPYAAAAGLRVRTKGGLSETGYEHDPRKAARHTERLLGRDQAVLVCTHRPVLAGVIGALAHAATDDVRAVLPRPSPPPGRLLDPVADSAADSVADSVLDPAEVLVAHVARRSGHQPAVVAVERHSPQR